MDHDPRGSKLLEAPGEAARLSRTSRSSEKRKSIDGARGGGDLLRGFCGGSGENSSRFNYCRERVRKLVNGQMYFALCISPSTDFAKASSMMGGKTRVKAKSCVTRKKRGKM